VVEVILELEEEVIREGIRVSISVGSAASLPFMLIAQGQLASALGLSAAMPFTSITAMA
jgi:hypothetical protein